MSISSLIQTSGFAVLKMTDGEALACPIALNAAQTITGVVNRNIVKGKDFLRLFQSVPVDFDVTGLTEVEVSKDDCLIEPSAGIALVDSNSYRHRVRMVAQTDTTWLLFCTPSSVV